MKTLKDTNSLIEEKRVKYQVLLEEAQTSRVPKRYSIVKLQDYKVILYLERDSLSTRTRYNKFISQERDLIFIGYNLNTTKHQCVYLLDLYYIVILSNIRFFEDIPRSQIKDFKLQIEKSDRTFKESKGNYSTPPIYNRVGRLHKNPESLSLIIPLVTTISKGATLSILVKVIF